MKFNRSEIFANAALGVGLCLGATIPALAQSTVSTASPTEITEQCEVTFRSGATLSNEASVADCVEDFKNLSMTRVEVMGYASPGGSDVINQRISQARADLVGARLSEAFPGITIDARGMGVDAVRGKSALITAFAANTATVSDASNAATSSSTAGVLADTPASNLNTFPQSFQGGTTTPSATSDVAAGDFPGGSTATDGSIVAAAGDTTTATDSTTPLQRENIPSGWNDVRLAGRVGYDKLWDRDEFMNAAGVDMSYVRRNVGTKLVRIEVGATTSFLGELGEDLKAYNFHGVVFPALEAGPVVFGPRGLLGGSWDDASRDTVIDAGGEGRLGVEAANYSIFISAGRTMELTRVGLDVGATF
jgi:hypothetical protein